MTDEQNDVISEETTDYVPEDLENGQAKPTEDAEINEKAALEAEKQELLEKLKSLEAELLREQIKVKLLILGILPEKLEDGAAMAYGLCLAGKEPDAAAAEIINAYPHLKAVKRELPQFSSESAGSGDGFSAIRKIFSAR